MTTRTEATSYQRLREHLAYLGMAAAAEHLAGELDRAHKDKLSATQVLESLLDIEVIATKARRTRGRLRFAHYPVHKTLSDFDFDFQPSLDRKVIAELSTLRFVEEKRNVILLGPPGVGKTHLAIALGIAATEAGYRTYFTSASDMVSSLQSAHLEGVSRYRMRTYTGPSVLVIDELGYLPLDQASANWIFEVVAGAHALVPCPLSTTIRSRRVIGWSIDGSPNTTLVTNALGMAIDQRRPANSTVIHSDQGTQFTSWAFTRRAVDSGLLPSMGSVGDCFDNAVMEPFWIRMQVELSTENDGALASSSPTRCLSTSRSFTTASVAIRPRYAHTRRVRSSTFRQPTTAA